MVSVPVFKKIKGTCWISILVDVTSMKTKTEQFDEIGRILVSGGLNDTKKIRKASAFFFANMDHEKP